MTQIPCPPKAAGTTAFTLAGIGPASLGGMAAVAAPYRMPFVIGALCLVIGAALLWAGYRYV